jgi:hypothetical protein
VCSLGFFGAERLACPNKLTGGLCNVAYFRRDKRHKAIAFRIFNWKIPSLLIVTHTLGAKDL